MISPIRPNINFKGKVILGTPGHEGDEAAGKKELSCLPESAKEMVTKELEAFKKELEAATHDEDIFFLNLAADVCKTNMFAQFGPPDVIVTGLGIEVLYATPRTGKHKDKLTIQKSLSLAQADFRSEDKKQAYKGQELMDNITAAFDKLRQYTYLEFGRLRISPKFQREEKIREIEDEIYAKEVRIKTLQAEVDAKKAELQKILDTMR